MLKGKNEAEEDRLKAWYRSERNHTSVYVSSLCTWATIPDGGNNSNGDSYDNYWNWTNGWAFTLCAGHYAEPWICVCHLTITKVL